MLSRVACSAPHLASSSSRCNSTQRRSQLAVRAASAVAPVQTLLERISGADAARIAHDTSQSLRSPDVNVVHMRRDAPSGAGAQLDALLPLTTPFTRKVAVSANNVRERVPLLLVDIADDELRALLEEDISSLCYEFLSVMGCEGADAKLQVVTGTSCSRWHADHVPARLLVTYSGPGTLFVENRSVDRRRWQRLLGVEDVGGYSVRPGCTVHQAQAWDALWLKGQAYPGFEHRGAVHRSPDGASEEAPRLLLALDAASGCTDACCAH